MDGFALQLGQVVRKPRCVTSRSLLRKYSLLSCVE